MGNFKNFLNLQSKDPKTNIYIYIYIYIKVQLGTNLTLIWMNKCVQNRGLSIMEKKIGD
jgi:hypothetical protein